MKNLLAAALLSLSGALIVSGGPVGTPSSTSSSASDTPKSISSTRRPFHSTTEGTNSTSSTGRTTSTSASGTKRLSSSTTHRTTSTSSASKTSSSSATGTKDSNSSTKRSSSSTTHRTTSPSSTGRTKTSASSRSKQTSVSATNSFSPYGNSSNSNFTYPAGSLNNSSSDSNDSYAGDPFFGNNTSANYSSPGASLYGNGSSANYSQPYSTSAGDGSAPPWNLNNVTCKSLTFLNSSQQWAAVNGDSVVETFSEMFSGNKLMCSECFGMDKGACTSKDPACSHGLSDAATISGSTTARWDTAVAIFAQDPDITDLTCGIGTGECSGAPSCESVDGPGAWALLKSLETMHNTLQNMYDAIESAGNLAGHQMTAFSGTFAPVPSFKNDAIWLTVMIAVVGAILGAASFGIFMPGIMPEAIAATIGITAENAAKVGLYVSTAVGAVVGGASGVGENQFFFSMPAPSDTDTVLGSLINGTLATYSNLCDQLMAQGSYQFISADGKSATTITLENLMKDGQLMQTSGNETSGFVDMVPVFEVILFQQLALYTWQNLENDEVQHTPYIVYDKMPCNKIDPANPDPSSILTYLPNIHNLDTNITYNGSCYWLLDAKPNGNRVFGKKVAPSFHCQGENALPGGTNKEMSQDSAIFAGLNLQDFIIPSVLGWQQNHYQNGYPLAASNGQLLSSPLDPAAVNLPICEYIKSPDRPGVGCPKLNEHQTNACEVYPPSTGFNQPGTYNDGWCGVHVDQWQRNEGYAINPLNNYQLSITVFDAKGIEVGQAIKESAAEALAVVDTSLPYDLIVAAGVNDTDSVKYWYSDQYWNSSNTATAQCSVGLYDSGMRQIDCGFKCPLPNGNPPVSATVAHPFPDIPTAAAGGSTTFVNTFTSANATTPTATHGPSATPTPTYATGQCGVHVVQYQKNESNSGNLATYQLEVVIYDAKQKPIGTSGQVPAPLNVPVPVPGLNSPFTVTAGATDDAPLVCKFQGRTITLDEATCGKHAIGLYDSGSRNMDCGFAC